MVVFTSICANYLHKARVLARSVKKYIPDAVFIVCMTAVSYTHLDVYKRQELGVSLTEEEKAEIEQVAADWEEYFGSEEEYESFLSINHLTKELAIQMELDTQLSNKVLEAAFGEDIKADVLENFVHVQHVLIQFEDAEADDHSAELAKAEAVSYTHLTCKGKKTD